MTALTVWTFDTPDGAKHAADLLEQAQRDQLITIDDHAVVSWPVGAANPTMEHSKVRGAGWGALWGGLIGTMFLVPVVGAAAGGAIGAARKAADGLGITEEQIQAVRDQVTEGTSALFLVSEGADLDRLGERMRGVRMKLIETNLTPAERDSLLENFGGR